MLNKLVTTLLASLVILLGLTSAIVRANEDDPMPIVPEDDDIDLNSFLLKKLQAVSAQAVSQELYAEMEARMVAGVNAVKMATETFMNSPTNESEEVLISTIHEFFVNNPADQDQESSLIAQQMVSNLKSAVAQAGICWKCPFCAAFAGPLSLAFPGLRALMKGRCQSSGPLAGELRARVACRFSKPLLDSVKLYWGCQYLNEKLFGRDIGMIPDGQTFSTDIFMNSPIKNDLTQAKTVIHELRHTQQYNSYGGVIPFGFKYLYHFCLRGFAYKKIDEEADAYAFAEKYTVCPTTPSPTRKPTPPTTQKPTIPPTPRRNGLACTSNAQCASGNCEEIEVSIIKPIKKKVCMP